MALVASRLPFDTWRSTQRNSWKKTASIRFNRNASGTTYDAAQFDVERDGHLVETSDKPIASQVDGHKCACPLRDLLINGCKCGGI